MGTDVRTIEVELNPKNLDTKVVTYDPMGERAPQYWTVRQAIQELETPEASASLPMETSPQEGEQDGETMNSDNGVTPGGIESDLTNLIVSLQKEGSVTDEL